MSYTVMRFLTVIVVLSTFLSTTLHAQRDIIKRELPELASPSATERARAALRVANMEEDISADLRVAYKFADTSVRLGLLKVVLLRGDGALVSQAAIALSNDDERLTLSASEYLLSLPYELLQPETSEFDEAQLSSWSDFQDFRMRRDIAAVLIDAHLMPGKYFSQFDTLRKFDPERLDRELLAIMDSDPEFAEPLNLASRDAAAREVTADRAFQPTWRRLVAGAGAFEPALHYQQKMELTEDVDRAVRQVGEQAYLAAQEVLVSLRAVAVRALSECPSTPELNKRLNATYDALMVQTPDPKLGRVIDLDTMRVEIELTLARFGDPELLDARIDSLRSQIQRVQQVKVNVNMQVASRPDLIAQNEIAHLKLRAGDLKGAEAEWKAAASNSRELMRDVEGRNRNSLSSYLAAVFYNLACAQSLQGKVGRAMDSLKEAVSHGYKDFGWMLEDGDLDQVRETTSFRDWFEDTAPPSVADRLGARD